MKWEDFCKAIDVYGDALESYNAYIKANKAIVAVRENNDFKHVVATLSTDFVRELSLDEDVDEVEDCDMPRVPEAFVMNKDSVIRVQELMATEAYSHFQTKLEVLKRMGVEVPHDPFPELRR